MQLPDNSDKKPVPGIMRVEVEETTHRLKLQKAPEIDNITTEEMKATTKGEGLKIIYQLCQRIWSE